MSLAAHTFSTPAGEMLAVVDGAGSLLRLGFLAGRSRSEALGGPRGSDGVRWSPRACAPVVEQLAAYFRGERQSFDLSLAPEGSPFQQAVWRQLRRIPFGRTVSYGELAARLGRPGAARAVGGAVGANPVAVVIPCHRVIGADGSLTGYGSGLAIKQLLLELEGSLTERRPG